MEEKVIKIESIDPKDFFGPQNKNIKLLKTNFPDLKIVARGNQIKAFGKSDDLFSNENYIDQNNGFFYCIYSPTVTSYKTVAKGLGDCELTIDDTGVVDKSGC